MTLILHILTGMLGCGNMSACLYISDKRVDFIDSIGNNHNYYSKHAAMKKNLADYTKNVTLKM